MSTTQLALPTDIPAHIRAAYEKAADQNKEAMGGIKAGSYPRLNIGGGKFSIVEGGIKTLLTDPTRPDLPAMELPVVIVGFNPAISKLYYEGEYEEGGETSEPTCSSDNGVTPDPHITKPVSAACANCPKNAWGSKITKQGKQVKACSDNKRLVLIMAQDLENEQALDLTIKPASLKPWAEYVRALDSKGISVDTIVTNIRFDPDATFPKLMFKFGRFLTEGEIAVAQKRSKGDDVRLIVSPRTSTATGPVPMTGPAPIAPRVPEAPKAPVAPAPAPKAPEVPKAPVAPAPAPKAPVAPAPAPKAPEVAPVAPDPYAGQPAHVKLAVEGAGGLDNANGQAVYKALTGKSVAEQPAPKPVDPYEGQPAHIKLAVDGAGGLTSVNGQNIYKMLTGKDAGDKGLSGTPAPEAPAKRTRRAAAPAPTHMAPPASTTAPQPNAPAPTHMAPPMSSTGNLGTDLDALLAGAMTTPTA